MNLFIYNALYIIIYSFLGWICEVLYCYMLDHKFTNRGFLNGPLCPVYGFGAIFVLTFLDEYKNNVLLVFIIGIIITSILEYITSLILEVSFHTKWWDYSEHKFNIHGRVCLLNSTLFGILSVILVEVINPKIVDFIGKFPREVIYFVTYILVSLIAIDFILTITTMLKLNSRLSELNELLSDFEELGVSFIEKTEKDLKVKINKFKNEKINREELIGKIKKLRKNGLMQRRLLKAFPNMKHKKHDEILQILRKLNEKGEKS